MNKSQIKIAILVGLIVATAVTYSVIQLGVMPLILLGIPAIPAYIFWYHIYLKNPVEPSLIIPLFLITAAAFFLHVIEEFYGHYSPAISRLFNFAWSDDKFILVILLLAAAICLVCVGLFYKKAIAGFIAIFFIVTRFGELALFIFPLIKPQIEPGLNETISRTINGKLVPDMPNYYFSVTHAYYWPGMYTVARPLITAFLAVYMLAIKKTDSNKGLT
ncbi:MAG: hypothetical protein ABIP51_02660 [Bacteroidia bacterium]